MLLGSGGRRSVCLCLLSVPSIGRAGLRREVGLLRPYATWPEGASAPNGTVMCQGSTRDDVTPAMRTSITDIGAATARVARSVKSATNHYHTSIINAKKLYNSTLLSSNLQSYLSSRSFTVDINGIKSPPSKLLYGVPQGSVLGPLLFILYTTPLSLIIPQSSVNHKLYADDIHFFLSFSADNFSDNILLLQNTITNISSWMASNIGMFYHIIFAPILILLNLIILSHCLLLNSTSNQKLTFFFILIFLSLSSLYWTDSLELWFGLFVIHYSFHIPHHRSVHLLNSFYVCHIVCQNILTGIQWIPVSFMMHSKSSWYHHIFQFTFSHFISSCVCHMHVGVWMRKHSE